MVGRRTRFADRFGIGGIVLLTPQIGLHIGRRHETHCVTQRRDLTRPIVGRCAGFHADQARRNLRQCVEECSASYLLAPDDSAIGIDRVKLENRLGQIKADRGNLHGGWSFARVASTTAHNTTHQSLDTGAIHLISRMRTRLHWAQHSRNRLASGGKALPLGQGGRAAKLVSLAIDEVALRLEVVGDRSVDRGKFL